MELARLTSSGIEGDRVVQVRNKRGRAITARTHPAFLGFRATLAGDGSPLVNGIPWNDSRIQEAVLKIAPDGRLVHEESRDRFDVLPLLVATDGAIAAFGRDRRRLRPNIILGDVPGLEERNWAGGQIVIGDVVIDIHDLRSRCIMTTFDPDTLSHDPGVLRDIVRRFDGKLALNCEVARSGHLRVNQEVRLIPR